ncbi:hypothetical protein ORI20_15710 [Mycobacterium sp. CVI_P3]|uniref:Uncharacterized protein n=1 Tax=Mycobacterium pinniadriaticum TaxID=2994102 RepID=A0ABT3SH46_9MYCO|nr:hypothetical protein [Mycobacterium pinniadriaticum]MCX2931728.1 hypothetical protein [Mycobacterium pinniadriaticum]MCX2938197.1 hypothetical protein [Mycobacterium pinniadriaticum]
MKVLLAAAGLVFAMMCFALVVIVEVLARLLPVLILAALLWGGWRIWRARRTRPATTPVPLLAAPFPAPIPVAMPQPAPIAPPIADPDVYLVAGDHLGMRPPRTPLQTPEATDVQGRLLVPRPHSRVR